MRFDYLLIKYGSSNIFLFYNDIGLEEIDIKLKYLTLQNFETNLEDEDFIHEKNNKSIITTFLFKIIYFPLIYDIQNK